MSYQRYLIHFTKTAINFKSTGATTIFTTDNGTERFYPMFLNIEMTAATLITIVGAISVGQNSASYNDILAISTLTGVTAANKMLVFNTSLAATSSIAANTDVKINVTTGFTATTATGKITLFGYYE